jgi:hypothetical protein
VTVSIRQISFASVIAIGLPLDHRTRSANHHNTWPDKAVIRKSRVPPNAWIAPVVPSAVSNSGLNASHTTGWRPVTPALERPPPLEVVAWQLAAPPTAAN